MKPVVMAEIQVVALGTGSTSMSQHVSAAVSVLEKLGIKYQLTPMGTAIEVSSLDEAFDAVKSVHEALVKNGVKRVVTHLTIDDRRDNPHGMEDKMDSVRKKL